MRASQRPFWCLVTPLYLLDPFTNPLLCRRKDSTSSSLPIGRDALEYSEFQLGVVTHDELIKMCERGNGIGNSWLDLLKPYCS